MSTIQAANLNFESTQNNVIQYTGSNTTIWRAAGIIRITANATGIFGAPSSTANSIVFLDNSGKLPALDGSQLTGVASPITYSSNSDIWTATSANTLINPVTMMGALGEVALTDAANVNVDFSVGINFGVTLGGNRTLVIATIPAAVVGRSGYIRVTQDGTGSRTLATTDSKILTINGEPPIFTTTASAVDYITYTIVSTTGVLMSVMRNVS